MLACKAFPAALWRMQSIWKRNKPAWGRNGMAGWNKKYSTETHWLGVSKAGWVRTLGEDNSLLCQNVSSPVRVIVPATGGASFGELRSPPFNTCAMDTLSTDRWRSCINRKGPGPSWRVRRSYWRGSSGGSVSACSTAPALGANTLDSASTEYGWGQPALLGVSTKMGAWPLHCAENATQRPDCQLTWSNACYFWWRTYHFICKEKKVQKHSLVEIKIGLFYYCKIWTLDCGLEIRS